MKNLKMSKSAQLAVPDPPQRPQFFRIARRYLWILACGALLGGGLGAAYALTRPATYTCQSTLLFPSAAPVSGLAALTGGGSTGDPSLPLLQGALTAPQVGSNAGTATLMVQSRRLKKQIIQRLKLGEQWELDNYSDVTERFERNLKCITGKTGELSIGFKDPSRDLSYQITVEVVKELKRLTLDLRLDPAADNVRFLEKKVNESQRKLAVAQRGFANYQQKYRLLDLTSQATNLAQRYADLQRDAAAARMEADIATRQVALLSSSARQMVSSAIDPNPTTGNTLSPLYQRVKEAESQLALLKYQLTDDHPQVQEQKRVLSQARRLLQTETSRQLSAVGTGAAPGMNSAVLQAAGSKARAAGLQQAAANLANEIDKLPKQAAGFMELQAAVQANVQALTLYQQELEKARILTQSRGPAVMELDPPELPIKPDKVSRVAIALFGLLIGLGFAAIFPYGEWQRRNDLYEDSRYAFEETRLARHSTDYSASQGDDGQIEVR